MRQSNERVVSSHCTYTPSAGIAVKPRNHLRNPQARHHLVLTLLTTLARVPGPPRGCSTIGPFLPGSPCTLPIDVQTGNPLSIIQANGYKVRTINKSLLALILVDVQAVWPVGFERDVVRSLGAYAISLEVRSVLPSAARKVLPE